MNAQNILTAIDIALALYARGDAIIKQIKAAHETGDGISDEQLAVIRGDVDVARAELVKTIETLSDEPDVPAEEPAAVPINPEE